MKKYIGNRYRNHTKRIGADYMFIPYRCEDCIHGEYLWRDSCWDCSIGVSDDEECEKNFEEDERT